MRLIRFLSGDRAASVGVLDGDVVTGSGLGELANPVVRGKPQSPAGADP